jgi:hypothetical protein
MKDKGELKMKKKSYTIKDIPGDIRDQFKLECVRIRSNMRAELIRFMREFGKKAN